MRRFYIVLITLATIACGTSEEQKRQQREATRRVELQADSAALKIAVMPTLDCLPLFVADSLGLFGQEGLDVRLRPYQAQMDADTAMLRGRVEAMVTDLVRAERMQRKGTALRYATQTNLSWQLVTNPSARLKRLEQLDDKMIAMTRYSATALLADHAVDSAKLKAERVFKIQVNDVGVRLNMLENGILDALLLPEPQATQARRLNSAVLMDTRQMDCRYGVIAFSEKVLKSAERQQQMSTFLKVYDMACDSINEQGFGAFSPLIVKHCGVSAETVDSLPADLRYNHATPPRQVDIDRAKAWLKYK
ncbi:MAG: ABC transporter substrate-binding protein [Prevotella sp.]|nr:ABC transporter substrate-binding protein [Prevotella sp.]